MTKREAELELDSVSSSVTRNRLRSVLAECQDVPTFANLTEQAFLLLYRKTDQGKDAKYDLGAQTYTILAAVQANLRAKMLEERKVAREEAKEEAKEECWVTKEELLAVATFMESFKFAKVELRRLKELLATFGKEDGNVQKERAALG